MDGGDRGWISHDFQTPVRWGWAAVSPRIDPVAVIRWSGPAVFCNSPSANISATRAFARAVFPEPDNDEDRSEMADSDNKPTATTVRSTINDSVTTKAKPRRSKR